MTSGRFLFVAVLFLFSATFASSNQEKAPTSINDLVIMNVSVWNRDQQPVKGLSRDAFDITDDNVKRSIEFFEDGDVPISIGVLIDSSGSADRRLAQAKTINEVLVHFVELGHPDNQYFVMSFNSTPRFLVDWSARQVVLDHEIYNVERTSGTATYDACFAALEKLRTAPSARRVLLLISDGYDDRSRRTFKDLQNLLGAGDVLFYGIGVFPDSPPGVPAEGQGVLDGLTELTGGKTVATKDKKEMMTAARIIAAELRSQYRIGFRPDGSERPNKWHRIKVRVTPPAPASKKLFVRTREGYFSR